MLEEKLQLLKNLLKQESVNKLEIKKLMFTFSSLERNEIIKLLSPEEQKQFIEVIFSTNYRDYIQVSKQIQEEYVKYNQSEDYVKELAEKHVSINETLVKELKKEVEKERADLVNSPEYASLLYNALCQHANYQQSTQSMSDYLTQLDLNLEYMTLYLDFLTVHADQFMEREVGALKESIQNSIYCARKPLLLEKALENLEENNKDSFLVLPVIQSLSNNDHSSSLIVHKEDGKIKVTMLDKAMHYSDKILSTVPGVDVKEVMNLGIGGLIKGLFTGSIDKNLKVALPYVLEFPATREMKTHLTYIFALGTTFLGRNLQLSLSSEKQESLLIQKKLLDLAESSYWGKQLYDGQYFGQNCYIKSISTAMQHVLGDRQTTNKYLLKGKEAELRKIPGHSAKGVLISLAEIMKIRMQKLGYSSKTLLAIDELMAEYCEQKSRPRTARQKINESKQLREKYNAKKFELFEKGAHVKLDMSLSPKTLSSSYFSPQYRGKGASYIKKEKQVPFQLCSVEDVEAVKSAIQASLAAYEQQKNEQRTLNEVVSVKSESSVEKGSSEKHPKKEFLER